MTKSNVTPIENSPMMSKKEVASFLGLSVGMVEKVMNQHDDPLPSYLIGRRRLIKQDELNEWINRRAA